jgi:hypothetical protein
MAMAMAMIHAGASSPISTPSSLSRETTKAVAERPRSPTARGRPVGKGRRRGGTPSPAQRRARRAEVVAACRSVRTGPRARSAARIPTVVCKLVRTSTNAAPAFKGSPGAGSRPEPGDRAVHEPRVKQRRVRSGQSSAVRAAPPRRRPRRGRRTTWWRRTMTRPRSATSTPSRGPRDASGMVCRLRRRTGRRLGRVRRHPMSHPAAGEGGGTSTGPLPRAGIRSPPTRSPGCASRSCPRRSARTPGRSRAAASCARR